MHEPFPHGGFLGVPEMRGCVRTKEVSELQKQSGDNEIMQIAQQVAGHDAALRKRAEEEKRRRRDPAKQQGD